MELDLSLTAHPPILASGDDHNFRHRLVGTSPLPDSISADIGLKTRKRRSQPQTSTGWCKRSAYQYIRQHWFSETITTSDLTSLAPALCLAAHPPILAFGDDHKYRHHLVDAGLYLPTHRRYWLSETITTSDTISLVPALCLTAHPPTLALRDDHDFRYPLADTEHFSDDVAADTGLQSSRLDDMVPSQWRWLGGILSE